jgi:hypothetical protein
MLIEFYGSLIAPKPMADPDWPRRPERIVGPAATDLARGNLAFR